MRICFFGHRDFSVTDELKERLMQVLKENITEDCEFFFGGYGVFDNLAYKCVSELALPYRIKKTFITPYITENYLKNHVEYHRYKYDDIVYPDIESTPYRFAISARNRWMVAESDVIICYINHAYGGAYQAVKNGRGKKTINIGKFEF